MEITFSSKVHSCYHKFLVEEHKQTKQITLMCWSLGKSKDVYKIIKNVSAANHG